jgi:hypothetical protein
MLLFAACENSRATGRIPGDRAERRHNLAVMTLAEDEERLVEALRALPPNVADHVDNPAP